MSETDSSAREVLALLDRAAAHTPPLHLAREDVIARGEQIVRRRRATGAGMTIGALALAGAVWLGSGAAGDGLLGTQQVSPAGLTWQVDEPTTLTLLDGVTRGGNVSPLTVTKDAGSRSATFVVDGHEETVEGRTMAGGADVFVGERATVVVWQSSPGTPPVTPLPAPQGHEAGPAQEDDDVWYLTTTDRGYLPQDLLFHDEDSVWTASGEVAETAALRQGPVSLTAFALPSLGVAGVIDQGSLSLMDPGWLAGSGGAEPWWQGGDQYEYFAVRLPREATTARMVWRDDEDEVVDPGEPVDLVHVGGSAFALFIVDPEDVDRSVYAYSAQWSSDGRSWRDREPADVATPGDFQGITFTTDGGTPVAVRGGQELKISGKQPGTGAWSWDDGEEKVVLLVSLAETHVPIARAEEGPMDARPHLVAQETVRVGDVDMLAGRLPAGTSLLGVAEDVSGGAGSAWRLPGAEPVEAHDLGGGVTVAVDEDNGLWLASYRTDGRLAESSDTVVGEVDGAARVLVVDGSRNRVAVVHVGTGTVDEKDQSVTGRDVIPVLEQGAVVLSDAVQGTGGVSTRTGAGPGVNIRSTQVQCLKADETCVLGMDTTGDGEVDLPARQDVIFAWEQDAAMEGTGVHGPGETVTVLGRNYVVRDTASGWPVLRATGRGGDITTAPDDHLRSRVDAPLPASGPHPIPGAWPWSDDATAYALPGVAVPDGLELLVEADGTWLEPEQVLVAQGSAGSVTVLVFSGTAEVWGAVGVRGDDGEVDELPLP